MSLGEMAVRGRAALRCRAERGAHRRLSEGRRAGGAVSKSPSDSRELLDRAGSLVPGTRRSELERLESGRAGMFGALAAVGRGRADAVLSGAWPLLGRPVDLRGEVDWHGDPRTGKRWPRRFYADLRLSDPAAGVDVKYVWELGRQQYLVELARGWLLEGDERYADRAKELMLDFIRNNRLYEGIHWTSALEVAMRAISWLWTLATLARWDDWHDDDLGLIAASLREHARYLEHHPSFYSSPYNHLIGEATGLYLVGIALSEFEESGRWKAAARRILLGHGPRQFYSDGFCVEQATGYHFYTLGFLAMAIAAARAEGEPLGELEPVVHRAFRAGAALVQPDGRWPAIGDVDSARSIPVFHEDFWDFRSLCSLGAALFEDGDLKLEADTPGEELYWLLGCEGIATWAKLPAAEPNRRVVLAESGYAVARQDGDWLLFDAGPIAHGLHRDGTPSTAHGHADALQVLYFSEGTRLLTDCGIPFYNGDAESIGHFRGPAAHNTLEIEGAPMARAAGPLEWTHVAARPELEADLGDEAWLARGVAAWGKRGRGSFLRSTLRALFRAAVVERNVLAVPGRGVWIADLVETDRPRRVRWFWQLPADTLRAAEPTGTAQSVLRGDGVVLAVWSGSESVPVDARVESAGEASPVAWHAFGYGLRSPGQRVCHEAAAATRLLVVTYVGRSPAPIVLSVRGQRIVCATETDERHLAAAASQQECDGDVVWSVWTESSVHSYCTEDRSKGRSVSPRHSARAEAQLATLRG